MAIRMQDQSLVMKMHYELDDRMIGVRFPAGTGNFFFDTMSRPALGLTQLPTQWVPEFFPWGVKLTTNLHLVQKSRNA
jgi:hypothetical protein